MRYLSTDYLVIGAGATGMAFADSLLEHTDDVHVTLVDRRDATGGHWRDAYPFVRLHQASLFYGVASTRLGTGTVQAEGPEAGLQERARQAEICAYYDAVQARFSASGRVRVLTSSEYHADGDRHLVTSLVSGEVSEVTVRRRLVDARYLAPTIPSTTPPPFAVAADVRLAPINGLARLQHAPRAFVIVGAGKTATDGIVWLLAEGVDPEAITWVRPRDPWMLDRARIQPDPALALGVVGDIMEAAAEAVTPEEMFLRLEAAGVMLRIDPAITPTMAKTPTLGRWELELLRQVERVVRLGHVRRVTAGEIVLAQGTVAMPRDALVVHCAASGLAYPPLVPLWGESGIRLQTIRPGAPCFNAALAGYVEATRDDDRERNRLCPPNILPDTPRTWARMQALGTRAARTLGAEPDIATWMNDCAMNAGRIPPGTRDRPHVRAAADRMARYVDRGLAQLESFAREPARDR